MISRLQLKRGWHDLLCFDYKYPRLSLQTGFHLHHDTNNELQVNLLEQPKIISTPIRLSSDMLGATTTTTTTTTGNMEAIKYGCTMCQVTFDGSESQRAHMREEWQ